jgi:hypothetical protein
LEKDLEKLDETAANYWSEIVRLRPVLQAAKAFADKSSDEEWFPDEEWTALCDALARCERVKQLTKKGDEDNAGRSE